MDRIVVALEDGSVKVDDGIFGEVNYLIFEDVYKRQPYYNDEREK